MTRYEQGFLTKCAEHGVDGRPLLAKMAQEYGIEEISTDATLSKEERKALKEALSKIRRKQISQFLSRIDDGLYTVRTKEYGNPTAMYDTKKDKMWYTDAQREERERRVRGKNLFWRSFLMGGVPLYTA